MIESTITDDRVKVELINGFDPLPISPYDEQSFGFQIVKKTVLDIFPEVTVAPGEFFYFAYPIKVTFKLPTFASFPILENILFTT